MSLPTITSYHPYSYKRIRFEHDPPITSLDHNFNTKKDSFELYLQNAAILKLFAEAKNKVPPFIASNTTIGCLTPISQNNTISVNLNPSAKGGFRLSRIPFPASLQTVKEPKMNIIGPKETLLVLSAS